MASVLTNVIQEIADIVRVVVALTKNAEFAITAWLCGIPVRAACAVQQIPDCSGYIC